MKDKSLISFCDQEYHAPNMRAMAKSIHSKRSKILTSWLAARRKDAGLTQRDLAQALGVVHSYVARIELGERRLDTVELIDYCMAIDSDPMEIVQLLKNA